MDAKTTLDAGQAAAAIRAAIADPTTAGERGTVHLNTGSSRRHLWLRTWRNLPGLLLDLKTRTYTHTLLPGWEYTPAELRTELIEDLERFHETGHQPTQATR